MNRFNASDPLRKLVVFACGFLLLFAPATVVAQRLEAQAIPGRPFGVAAITLPPQAEPWIEEQNDRVFYPAFSSGVLTRLLAGDDDASGGSGVKSVLFLFTGDAPLQLTVRGTQPTTISLRPEPQPPRVQTRLLQRWWREFNNSASDLTRKGDYPPLVQEYLTSMLGQRLGLRPPILTRITQGASDDQQVFDVLLGTERLHLAKLRESIVAPRDAGPANQPIPQQVSWRPPPIALTNMPEMEPMARHVPEECFYIRFGTFDNYLWLEDLLTSYGGDIGRMVKARGQEAKAGDRIRKQISLPQTVLAKVFGSQLIEDVALIGRDLYMQDGAAIGVLFQAKNGTLLSVSINQQRNQALAAERKAGATLETVKIGGRDVSLLSTPDNRIRSFYAIDGKYHLVSTSRQIIERFLEAGEGKRAIGDLPEFQRARTVMPLSRNDLIFAFMSTRFLSGLLAPQYQIELNRRMQALVDLELVSLAQLAAAAEKHPATTMEDLIAGGFLPAGFGRQADGSGPIIEADRVIDSLRGARGTFLPIPDVDLEQATAAENAKYVALAQTQLERWQQLDPIMAAIRREELGGKRERMTVEANISPVAEAKYGKYLSVLGPPVTQKVVPRAGDIIYGQASVTGGQFSALVPPHLLFFGVQDAAVPTDVIAAGGILQWLRTLQNVPGYLGGWPKPVFIDWLPLFRGNQVTPDGYSRLPFDVWRWQGDGFSVLSFQREILDAVVPQLLIAESDDPAQFRLHVGDLSQSQFKDAINVLYHQRAWQTSVANTKLLHSLTQQLRVPPEQSLAVAEKLLDTHLVCPLGGKYELVEAGGRRAWRSTAWATSGDLPVDYQAPLLQWFRGVDASLTKSGDQLIIRSQIEMQR